MVTDVNFRVSIFIWNMQSTIYSSDSLLPVSAIHSVLLCDRVAGRVRVSSIYQQQNQLISNCKIRKVTENAILEVSMQNQ